MKQCSFLAGLTALLLSVSCVPAIPAPQKHPQTQKDDGPIKILAIGNSFSEDSVEQYLYELFEATGREVVIGNLFKAGCKLEEHYQFMTNGETAYSYRKVEKGKKATTYNVTMLYGLQDEEWDYVSIQQASGFSGLYETYTPYLPALLEYIRKNVKGQEMRIVLHQTWSYDTSSNNGHYRNYDYDQMKMFNAILDATSKAVKDNPSISMVIPTGTAIQNARTSYLGDSFNRDGHHLETTYGRYTAACTWYEAISGKSVVGNTYVPSSVDLMQKAVAQNAAHLAVQTPGAVTDMTGFKTPLTGNEVFAAPVYVDFGGAMNPASPWFKVSPFVMDSPVFPKDKDGTYCPVSISSLLSFSDSFNGSEDFASNEMTAGSITFPKSVWEDALVVKAGEGPGKVVLAGFDPGRRYDLTLLSMRFFSSSDSRVAEFTVEGAGKSEARQIHSDLKTIETGTDYRQYVAEFPSVAPSSNGKITISVKCITREALLNALVIQMH